MKIFLAPANHKTSAREIARGCLSANLVVPGMGSMVAGRKVGYAQLILGFGGLAVTLVSGIHFIYWMLSKWSEFYGPDSEFEPDPLIRLRYLLYHARGSFLGMFLFAVAWLWALHTSRRLINEAKREKPPQL